MCTNPDGHIFPGKCLTESGNYPDEPCVFPFKYKNWVFNGCIPETNGGKAWCSTEVDADGVHVEQKWGYCKSESCMIAFAYTCADPGKDNPPPNYTYNNATGKFYKGVNIRKNWTQASDACTSEGANLIEFRNLIELQVLEDMWGK